MKIYVDAIGWHVSVQKCGVAIVHDTFYPTNRVLLYSHELTVNELEYLAVIQGLTIPDSDNRVYSDSQLVVNQINGNWECKALHLQPYLDIAIRLSVGKEVIWVPREENLAGHYAESISKRWKKDNKTSE